jgi:hypothetical protein
MDECCASSTSNEWLGRINYEWNADIDVLEQVCLHTSRYNEAMLTASDTSTIPRGLS